MEGAEIVTGHATTDRTADARAALEIYRRRCIAEANRLLGDANWAQRLLEASEKTDE